MTNANESKPPPDLPQGQDAGPVLAVRIMVKDKFLRLLCGENSRIATQLLSQVLEISIEAAGLPVRRAPYNFPFSQALLVFDLAQGQPGPALEAILRELSALRLLDSAQVAWRNPQERTWRLYHPKGGTDFMLPSKAEWDAEHLITEGTLRKQNEGN